MKIEDLRAKSKKFSLEAKGVEESDGTYHIWSSGSNDEERCHRMHDTMYAKHGDKESDKEKVRIEVESDNIGWGAEDDNIEGRS